MVVVEGVARSLNPQINIWSVAQPIVEDYIKQNIGPRALARDLARTARVVARFGPRLPQLAEAALLREQRDPPKPKRSPFPALGWMAAGGGLTALGIWTASLF
jgi:ubiquinone biosynthesis protein